ncbi:hypothetical protein EXW58_28860 (plasmid) [Bacillus mycoides]|nr:hypothetical protein EXW58_28860 [Bacillus mycoides]
MNRFCFSILITSFFRVLVLVCPSFRDYLHKSYSFCTRTKNKPKELNNSLGLFLNLGSYILSSYK